MNARLKLRKANIWKRRLYEAYGFLDIFHLVLFKFLDIFIVNEYA